MSIECTKHGRSKYPEGCSSTKYVSSDRMAAVSSVTLDCSQVVRIQKVDIVCEEIFDKAQAETTPNVV